MYDDAPYSRREAAVLVREWLRAEPDSEAGTPPTTPRSRGRGAVATIREPKKPTRARARVRDREEPVPVWRRPAGRPQGRARGRPGKAEPRRRPVHPDDPVTRIPGGKRSRDAHPVAPACGSRWSGGRSGEIRNGLPAFGRGDGREPRGFRSSFVCIQECLRVLSYCLPNIPDAFLIKAAAEALLCNIPPNRKAPGDR